MQCPAIHGLNNRLVECALVSEDPEFQLGNSAVPRGQLAALAALYTSIAHQFNNILQVIVGSAEAARLAAIDRPAAVDSLDTLLRATERAGGIMGQIRAIGEAQVHDPQPVHVHSLLTESIRQLGLPPTVRVEVSVTEDAPPALGDAAQLQAALEGIIVNAAEALQREDGLVRIDISHLAPDDVVEVGSSPMGEEPFVRVSVTDGGVGMNRHTLERIFEPFFSTKGQPSQAGLGLSVVHAVVEAHRGTVEVRSESGKGSRFDLYFPAASNAGREVEAARASEPGPPAGERILVVDDDPDVAELLRTVLSQTGYVVDAFTDPREALRVLRDPAGSFDLVLTDLTMPHVNGLVLAQEAAALREDLPVILFTGVGPNRPPQDVETRNVRHVLVKPVTRAKLLDAVSRVLVSGRA